MSDKLERLLNLIAALLDTAVPLPADAIRTRVEGYPEGDGAFHRAFERDKEELREMGIPVHVTEVPGVDPPILGYRILRREYTGKDPNLAPDELAALHVAASLVRVEGVDASGALRKLGGFSDDGAIHTAPLAAIPVDPRLPSLFAAAAELRVARFDYAATPREVEPHVVTFSRGHWYVSGFDRTRQGERLFRVDRIEGDVAVGPSGSFERPATITADPRIRAWELGDDDPIEARVLIDADQALLARHIAGDTAVLETRDDGSIVLALTVRNRPAFRGVVLSFLEHAEVLDPPELREDVVQWLRSLAGLR